MPSQFWRQKRTTSRYQQGHPPPEVSAGGILTCSYWFWCLPAIFCVLWLAAASFQSLLHCHMAIFPVCPLSSNLSHFIRTVVIGFWVHPIPAWLHLNFIISAKALFPNQFTFTGTGVRTSTYHFGGTQFNPQHVPIIMRKHQKCTENVSFTYEVCATQWFPNTLAWSHCGENAHPY